MMFFLLSLSLSLCHWLDFELMTSGYISLSVVQVLRPIFCLWVRAFLDAIDSETISFQNQADVDDQLHDPGYAYSATFRRIAFHLDDMSDSVPILILRNRGE